jgi:hypothetical protein
MKLAKLIDQGFQSAVRVLLKQPLPLKTAYKLRGVVKRVDEELGRYEEVRKKALQKYGNKKEDGTLELTETNQVQFEPAKMQAFMMELGDLTNLDIDMPTIMINELGDDIVLSAEDLMNLEGLLVD